MVNNLLPPSNFSSAKSNDKALPFLLAQPINLFLDLYQSIQGHLKTYVE